MSAFQNSSSSRLRLYLAWYLEKFLSDLWQVASSTGDETAGDAAKVMRRWQAGLHEVGNWTPVVINDEVDSFRAFCHAPEDLIRGVFLGEGSGTGAVPDLSVFLLTFLKMAARNQSIVSREFFNRFNPADRTEIIKLTFELAISECMLAAGATHTLPPRDLSTPSSAIQAAVGDGNTSTASSSSSVMSSVMSRVSKIMNGEHDTDVDAQYHDSKVSPLDSVSMMSGIVPSSLNNQNHEILSATGKMSARNSQINRSAAANRSQTSARNSQTSAAANRSQTSAHHSQTSAAANRSQTSAHHSQTSAATNRSQTSARNSQTSAAANRSQTSAIFGAANSGASQASTHTNRSDVREIDLASIGNAPDAVKGAPYDPDMVSFASFRQHEETTGVSSYQ